MNSVYSASEIAHAKSTSLNKFTCLAETAFVTGRRGSSSRPQHEAELDDICGAIEHLDNKTCFKESVSLQLT
jgi:hypothetical protein